MNGKTVIITGASSGLGKISAIELAKLGAHITMICRNREKSETVRQEIISESGNKNIDLIIADLSSLASVRKAAEEFKAKHQQLHVLMNNAGGLFTAYKKTEDGLEYTMAANHYGHFLLTWLLLDLLKASSPSRIINISSSAHFPGKLDFDDINMEKKYKGFKAYCNAKLANIYFAKGLTERLKGTGVIANACHPGGVRTGFAHNNKGIVKILITLSMPFLISPARGARTQIYLASSNEVEGVSGEYFVRKKPKMPSKEALNAESLKKFWELSEKFTSASY